MAAGLPVICMDLGGLALQVTEESGVKITASSPDQAVYELASAMDDLATDASRRARLGEAAHQRVMDQFNWEKKGLQLSQIYGQIANV
jgi:glycosyltransferase involved in cell wall biosynthesis